MSKDQTGKGKFVYVIENVSVDKHIQATVETWKERS